MTAASAPGRADRAIRRFSTFSLLVVWAIAAAASFTHIRELAAAHGQVGWVAWAIAISLELVVGLAALEILRDSRTGHRSAVPWLVLLVGAGLVLATNLASAEQTPWGWVLAGWPAMASMAATKLFVRRLRHAAEDDDAALQPSYSATWPAGQYSAAARGASLNGGNQTLRLPDGIARQDEPTGAGDSIPGSSRLGDSTELASLRERARQLYTESLAGGAPLTGDELGRVCGMGARWGRQRIAEAKRSSLNGAQGGGREVG